MKKVVVIIAAITFSITACHYGKEEAKETLERNEKYKSEKVEEGPAIDPAYIEANGTKEETKTAVDTVATATTDSTHQEEVTR